MSGRLYINGSYVGAADIKAGVITAADIEAAAVTSHSLVFTVTVGAGPPSPIYASWA